MDTKDMRTAGGKMADLGVTLPWRGWLAVALVAKRRSGRGGRMSFRPGEISTQLFGETLGPGRNRLDIHPVRGPGTFAAQKVYVE